jgi:hypothetical protein
MSPLSRRSENCDPAIRASVALLPHRRLEDEGGTVDMFLHDHLDIAYAVEGFEPVLLRVIRLFRRLFPMVEFGIRELQYHQQVPELISRRIDLGYVGIRFPELESELVFECLRKTPFLVAFLV